MQKLKTYLQRNASTICILVALLLFTASLLINTSAQNADHVAQRVSHRLEKRMEVLDGFMQKAMEEDHEKWLILEDLPEDMVIYRYVYDTIQSWCNQFPVINDNISSRLIYQRLSNLRPNIDSPLSRIGEKAKYINLGQKWYLIKSISDGAGCKIIAGIEISDMMAASLRRSDNGTNRHLKIPANLHIYPISYCGGSPVSFEGEDIFKLIADTVQESPFLSNSTMRWFALLFAMLASCFYLLEHRTLRTYFTNVAILISFTVIAYIWGTQMKNSSEIFSPTIYAGSEFLYSFGALMLINFSIFLIVGCSFTVRGIFLRKALTDGRKSFIIYGSAITGSILAIATHSWFSLKSLIMNSNISLELYMWQNISIYTVMVYISYTGLMLAILFLGQMLMPIIYKNHHKKFNLFSNKFIIFFAIACGIYFTAVTGILGLKKEHDRLMVTASKLAVDRDLGLELQLLNMEENIAKDPYIAVFSTLGQSNNMIFNRLTENYMPRISQAYTITVATCDANDIKSQREFDKIIARGTPISYDSKFIYIYDANGRSGYAGQFYYYNPQKGIKRVLIELYPKSYREDKGYYSILGRYAQPEDKVIPNYYSYAKYVEGVLVSYKGDYAYPTVISTVIRKNENNTYRVNGFIHFAKKVADNEIIVISRNVKTANAIFVTGSYLSLILYLVIYLISPRRKTRRTIFKRNYFRSSMTVVLCTAIILALAVMTFMSITFVSKRNELNTGKMMTAKINTIQTMFAAECLNAENWMDLNTLQTDNIIKNIGTSTESDITLYTPEGKVFKSTTPDVFQKHVMGSRMDQDAYYNIKYMNHRFYIHSEKFEGYMYNAIYAPIFNAKNKMVAIINSPYNDHSYDLRMDAMFHAASIINLVLILIVLTIFISTTIINAMFKPLVEIGNRMTNTNIHLFEYIIYKRNDEISSIVDAYNRMVHDLKESTKQLTKVERDKAWSEMARQVAHEIKNPLTPIKLEIQRLIRLKQKNDPSWEDKFDKVAAIVLEHIDILTDTANEFSTFAKLYTEEPVEMNIDKALRDQLVIFDNKENIKMEYIGLTDATVMAPKSQLIRVFVNLITNAIQAIEQNTDDGKGRINIYLRNSIRDGYYDIVFEDTGPGVNEDNLSKLFKPNFTTKSGGSGLGLAICWNIVKKCQGEITYQRSPILKGACFTVRLPKMESRI